MDHSVVNIGVVKGKVISAIETLKEVVQDIETKTIVQTLSTPEPPKKAKKGGGRPRGSKNKTAEAPPSEDKYMEEG